MSDDVSLLLPADEGLNITESRKRPGLGEELADGWGLGWGAPRGSEKEGI